MPHFQRARLVVRSCPNQSHCRYLIHSSLYNWWLPWLWVSWLSIIISLDDGCLTDSQPFSQSPLNPASSSSGIDIRFIANDGVCTAAKQTQLTTPFKFLTCNSAMPQSTILNFTLVIGTLRVAVHTSGTVDEMKGLNCDLKWLKTKLQTTTQHQQHALVVF